MTLIRDEVAAARLQFGLLGPLSATLDGTAVGLGGRRQRGVIAALLLARGQQVSAERLLDTLWAGEPPKSGAAGLQAYVSHLRRALEPDRPARAPSTVLVSQGQGYALKVPADAVDAWRFERLVAEATATADPRRVVAALREGLALWRGPALGEYADEPWAEPDARKLTELHSLARERLLGARLDTGESALLVPEIEALLDEEPLREERWRLLALALYRSHRQADSLAALRRARALLADELGVDPGPALRALEAEVLAQAPSLDAPPAPVDAVPAHVGIDAVPVQAAPPAPEHVEPAVVPAPNPDLVDRDAELAVLRACFDDAMAGSPSLVVISGPAGIGKSALLAEARARAAERGARVLVARGSPLEKEYGFGAVRQLLEPVLGDTAGRQGLLGGAAAGAAGVFDVTQDAAAGRSEGIFGVLHGLYWLTANLVETGGPLVLAVDDVQWCDTSSLRYLAYLVRRLGGQRLLVVATLRTGETYVDEELVNELLADPSTVTLQPAPLSLEGVADLVRDRLAGADDAFVAACHRTTAGNPLLLRQLLRALQAERIHPDAAHADTVRAIGSRAVSSLVLMRFRRLPEAARRVARTVAVLGDGALLPDVAAMTGLSEDDTAAAVAALARAEVLRSDHPLGFVHPLVGDAVYQDVPVGERELAHERAARVLGAAGASPEHVAAHLLLVPPRGDEGVVVALREAARRNAERGSADSAASYLRRAVAEPPGPAELPALLMELGRVETFGDGHAAMEHLTRAYRLLEDPALKAEAAIMLARTAVFAAQRGDATRLAHAALKDLPEELVDERQHLEALARISAYMHSVDARPFDPATLPAVEGTGPGARALAADLAWEYLCAGTDRQRAIELATFALDGGGLTRADPGLLWVVAAIVLEMSGEDSLPFWEEQLAESYRSGSLFGALSVHLWMGYVQWQRGDLREALQSMASCTEQNELWGTEHVGQSYADTFAIWMLLDRGDVAAARETLELARGRGRFGEGIRLFAEAEAGVLLAEGRAAESLDVLLSVRDEMPTVLNPAWRDWRSQQAAALTALGRRSEAERLLVEELALARRWGEPSRVGRTLRLLGEVRGSDGLADLREAVALLSGSPRRLELARARTSLAEALLDLPGCTADDEAEARKHLEAVVEMTEQCLSTPLPDRVRAGLTRLGVALPAAPESRLWLTKAERRIAEMAADGVSPSAIAQALFITRDSVQTILSSVSERLGVSTSEELSEALAAL